MEDKKLFRDLDFDFLPETLDWYENLRGIRRESPIIEDSTSRDIHSHAQDKIKEIIIGMNGLSEIGFTNRIHNDAYFRKGFDVLVRIFKEAKFE